MAYNQRQIYRLLHLLREIGARERFIDEILVNNPIRRKDVVKLLKQRLECWTKPDDVKKRGILPHEIMKDIKLSFAWSSSKYGEEYWKKIYEIVYQRQAPKQKFVGYDVN